MIHGTAKILLTFAAQVSHKQAVCLLPTGNYDDKATIDFAISKPTNE